jgi:uncharacterized protein (DUF1778 family)
MASRKSPPEPRQRSGYAREDQRHTERIVLRMQPEIVAMLRASAEHEEMTLSQYVASLVQRGKLDARVRQAEADQEAYEERTIRMRQAREG